MISGYFSFSNIRFREKRVNSRPRRKARQRSPSYFGSKSHPSREKRSVKRDASQEEIQKAYRPLAKKLHPNLNPGNRKAEEEFKNVSVAYDLLGYPDKRARFDRGEIDASGAERPQHRYYRDFAEGGASHHQSTAANSGRHFVTPNRLMS
jgi:curved DNA-binding protein CbpA